MPVASIQTESKISLHFALRMNADGETQELDSTFGKKAADFVLGDGNLLPGFEKYLMGLTIGDHKTFSVPPEEAFGQPNPQNVQEMKRSDFAPDMPLSPGLVVSFADEANAELPGVIQSAQGDVVVVDFNHPLAGKTLEFEVQILSVENA